MRRKDREIVDYNEMLDILKNCDCCRLGLKDKDNIYIVPLNFGYEENQGKLILYFHSAKVGKKIDLLKAQPHIGFEMDTKHELVEQETACGYSYLYQSIIGQGDISFVEDNLEKISALTCILSHYSTKDNCNWTFKEEMVENISIIKLEITTWSCKANNKEQENEDL